MSDDNATRSVLRVELRLAHTGAYCDSPHLITAQCVRQNHNPQTLNPKRSAAPSGQATRHLQLSVDAMPGVKNGWEDSDPRQTGTYTHAHALLGTKYLSSTTIAPTEHVNPSTPQPLKPSTPQPLNPSTPQPLNPSSPQALNPSTPKP